MIYRIARVASVDQIKAIRNKVSYILILSEIIDNKQVLIDSTTFQTLNRKAIKTKIAEYIIEMKIGNDIDLYVNYGYDDEQLMTLTKNGDGVKAIVDDKLGLCHPDLQDYQE